MTTEKLADLKALSDAERDRIAVEDERRETGQRWADADRDGA